VTECLIVEKNFSKAAGYYHKNALAQKYAAEVLADICSDFFTGSASPETVLEVGCGTGFLTSKLFQLYHKSEFIIADLSADMLNACKVNTELIRKKFDINAEFKKLNIENQVPAGKYDLIISSLTFQWIEDFESLIIKLTDSLSDNGILLFSTLTDKTFAGLKKIFESENVAYPGPELFPGTDIHAICSRYGTVRASEKVFTEHFQSLLDALRHIKKTGAGNASGVYTNPGVLKRILKYYSGPFDIDYHIFFAAVRKFGDL
jgi:malonyl-CoA O-methyltransferase